MKASDLRIGNRIMFIIDGTPVTVAGEISSISKMKFRVESDPLTFYDLDECTPIPLTEAWLVKFGALSDEPSTPFFIVSMPRNIGEIRVNPKNGMTWLRHWSQPAGLMNPESLFYVHQLQNLYHSLCGEELTIKPELK